MAKQAIFVQIQTISAVFYRKSIVLTESVLEIRKSLFGLVQFVGTRIIALIAVCIISLTAICIDTPCTHDYSVVLIYLLLQNISNVRLLILSKYLYHTYISSTAPFRFDSTFGTLYVYYCSSVIIYFLIFGPVQFSQFIVHPTVIIVVVHHHHYYH